MLNRRISILGITVVAAVGLQLAFISQSFAQFNCSSAPAEGDELFQTQEACDATLGDVRLIVDAFGATGSASGGGQAVSIQRAMSPMMAWSLPFLKVWPFFVYRARKWHHGR